MAKVKVEMNHDGMRDLLKSPELEKYLGELAQKIAGACGEGYAWDTKQMPTRVIASAYTDTYDAMKDNAANNTLLKAL